jgi:hypothetical protein
MKGGMNGFLAFNLVAIFIFLYGLVELVEGNLAGIVFSFILGLTGIFTFSIHMYFLGKGHKAFRVPFSIAILVLTLIVSIAEIIFTILNLI